MAVRHNYDADIDRSRLSISLKEQLRLIFRKHIHIPISGTRRTNTSNGVITQKFRSLQIVAMLEDLTVTGPFKKLALEGIRQKHIDYLVAKWIESKYTRGTIENKISYLGALLTWIEKAELKATATMISAVRELPSRSWIADQDKTWTGTKINVADVVSRILSEDIHVGTQLLLQLNFGLRAREAMVIIPLLMDDRSRRRGC